MLRHWNDFPYNGPQVLDVTPGAFVGWWWCIEKGLDVFRGGVWVMSSLYDDLFELVPCTLRDNRVRPCPEQPCVLAIDQTSLIQFSICCSSTQAFSWKDITDRPVADTPLRVRGVLPLNITIGDSISPEAVQARTTVILIFFRFGCSNTYSVFPVYINGISWHHIKENRNPSIICKKSASLSSRCTG